MVHQFSSEKRTIFQDKVKVDMGRVGVGLGLEFVSTAVFWGIFRNIPSRNTGTTRGPHQIPRFLYFVLDTNSWVRSRPEVPCVLRTRAAKVVKCCAGAHISRELGLAHHEVECLMRLAAPRF